MSSQASSEEGGKTTAQNVLQEKSGAGDIEMSEVSQDVDKRGIGGIGLSSKSRSLLPMLSWPKRTPLRSVVFSFILVRIKP